MKSSDLAFAVCCPKQSVGAPLPGTSPRVMVALVLGACEGPVHHSDPEADGILSVVEPFDRPGDPLQGSGVESCAVLDQEREVGGLLQRCDVYDVASGTFPPDPDPLLRRAFLYDRWYDLYHQPQGLTVNRVFQGEMLPGSPEDAWGAPDAFDSYDGAGDAAIWTGKALSAYTIRYLETGTEADRLRMEDKARDLVALFDVTGIEGYLARYHYLLVEDGTPRSDRYLLQTGEGEVHDHAIDPDDASGLDSAYFTGLVIDDQTYTAVPMWRGNPSIDQYTGPLTAFGLSFGLLEDAALRDRIATHVKCYLNRLERIEIVNLQDNPVLLQAALDYLYGVGLNVEDGDIDFATLDRIVAFGLPQYNSLNQSTFDRTCPSGLPNEADRVLDATDPDFLADLVSLGLDLQSGSNPSPTGIDHVYVVSVRGADAIHMMNLATLAYRLTGDAAYRDFLIDELIGELGANRVAMTAGALVPPPWCREFFGTHIAITPLWSLIHQLGDSPLRDEMRAVMEQELWQKDAADLGHASMDLYFAGTVPGAVDREFALARALDTIEALGGNGGVLDDPRRTYSIDREVVIDAVGERCPTEYERSVCEDGFEVLGVEVAGQSISHECTGNAGECAMTDGSCAWSLSEGPLPVELRVWEDYLWQRSPFKMGAAYESEGRKQSPGLDFLEAFWLARLYDYSHAGEGVVLAWRNEDACTP